MKRIINTLLFVAVTVALTGCDASQVSGPEQPNPVPVDNRENAEIDESNVYSMESGITVGRSRLGRNGSSVRILLNTTGIPEEQALTLWWIIFNNPSACASSPCGEPDLFLPEVEADVLYAAGSVVTQGRAEFSATLRENDNSGSIAHLFEMPGAPGMVDAEKAEVHLVVRSHGPIIPDLLDRQLGSYEGGCEVELTPGEMPDREGECSDIQFSVHQAL